MAGLGGSSFPPVPGALRGYYKFPFLYPTGDETGAQDPANINLAWEAGLPVFLMPCNPATLAGRYYIGASLTPKSGSLMTGFQWYAASFADNYGAGAGGPGGALLYVVPGFPADYVIDMVNDTGSQYYGVDLSGFNIFANDNFACGGIRVHGAWGAGFLRGIAVEGTTLDCLHFEVSGATEKEPDEWTVAQSKFAVSYNGYGVYCDNLPDSTFTDVISTSCGLDSWYLGFGYNTRLNNCRGEQSNGAGFHLGGLGAGRILSLNQCTTQFNKGDGILFDNTGGGALGTYQLNGFVSTNDNQSGGTTAAGIRSSGCLSRVMAVNCFAAGSAYGAYEGGGSYGMYLNGSSLSGTAAATHDDGTNTHALTLAAAVPW